MKIVSRLDEGSGLLATASSLWWSSALFICMKMQDIFSYFWSLLFMCANVKKVSAKGDRKGTLSIFQQTQKYSNEKWQKYYFSNKKINLHFNFWTDFWWVLDARWCMIGYVFYFDTLHKQVSGTRRFPIWKSDRWQRTIPFHLFFRNAICIFML